MNGFSLTQQPRQRSRDETASISLVLLSFLISLGIDQISKYIAGFFTSVTLNTGISFGLFSESTFTSVLVAVLVVIAAVYGKRMMQEDPPLTGMFFGGSVSNLVDRVLLGGVRDFLPVPLTPIYNNLADWMIVISVALFFTRSVLTKKTG